MYIADTFMLHKYKTSIYTSDNISQSYLIKIHSMPLFLAAMIFACINVSAIHHADKEKSIRVRITVRGRK